MRKRERDGETRERELYTAVRTRRAIGVRSGSTLEMFVVV